MPCLAFALPFTLPPVPNQIQGKFDSINSQLNNAKDIYSDGDQDLEAAAAEAAAEAEVSDTEGRFVDLDIIDHEVVDPGLYTIC